MVNKIKAKAIAFKLSSDWQTHTATLGQNTVTLEKPSRSVDVYVNWVVQNNIVTSTDASGNIISVTINGLTEGDSVAIRFIYDTSVSEDVSLPTGTLADLTAGTSEDFKMYSAKDLKAAFGTFTAPSFYKTTFLGNLRNSRSDPFRPEKPVTYAKIEGWQSAVSTGITVVKIFKNDTEVFSINIPADTSNFTANLDTPISATFSDVLHVSITTSTGDGSNLHIRVKE